MIVVIQTSVTKIFAEEELSIQLLVMGIAVEVLEVGLQKALFLTLRMKGFPSLSSATMLGQLKSEWLKSLLRHLRTWFSFSLCSSLALRLLIALSQQANDGISIHFFSKLLCLTAMLVRVGS
jgi:hypothetical protein